VIYRSFFIYYLPRYEWMKIFFYGTDKFFRGACMQNLLPWDVWQSLSFPPWLQKWRLAQPASLVGRYILGLLGQWPIRGKEERREKREREKWFFRYIQSFFALTSLWMKQDEQGQVEKGDMKSRASQTLYQTDCSCTRE